MSQPHSICLDCPEEFADNAAAREHGMITLAAAPRDEYGNARGHGTRVVNPTPAEAKQSRIESDIFMAIEDATQRLCDTLEEDMRRGELTEEQIRQGLRGTGFEDAWDEYIEAAS